MAAMNRRDFLKQVAALAALVQLPGLPATLAQIEKDEELLALLRELGKHEEMTVYRASPLNAGSPLEPLRAAQETPADIFYLRNHAPVPRPDADSWRLEVDGLVERPLSLSLADLQRDFPRHEQVATLQCAGFRRQEMLNEDNAFGAILWCSDAIGNGRWGGVRLRDVLQAAGVQAEAQHLAALGLDEIREGRVTFGFGGSIPLYKALGEEIAAGRRTERRAAAGRARLAAASGGARLHRRPQRQVAGPPHAAGRAIRQLLSAARLQGLPARRGIAT